MGNEMMMSVSLLEQKICQNGYIVGLAVFILPWVATVLYLVSYLENTLSVVIV